jgi:phosphoribosyl 1,2-cyclic phosphate phosphodiesterase
MRRFGYIFESQGGYPAICDARPTPEHGVDFDLDGASGPIPVSTFDVDHGEIRAVGYRFGGVAYTPDAIDFPEESWEALSGLDVWIVDALRWTPHPTHAHVEKALGWIERARPKRAILTNLHIDLDYNALAAQLPLGVEPAYDGMSFVIEG